MVEGEQVSYSKIQFGKCLVRIHVYHVLRPLSASQVIMAYTWLKEEAARGLTCWDFGSEVALWRAEGITD